MLPRASPRLGPLLPGRPLPWKLPGPVPEAIPAPDGSFEPPLTCLRIGCLLGRLWRRQRSVVAPTARLSRSLPQGFAKLERARVDDMSVFLVLGRQSC